MRTPIGLALLCAVGCGLDDVEARSFDWQLPPGFPEPLVPDDNPMTEAKFELGRHLFYDERLSGNGTQACASCHEQAKAFADGKVLPTGSTGDTVPRNAMSLTNVGYLTTLTWANPVLDSLETQAPVPMFGEFPVELGMTGREADILDRFASDPLYQRLFADAFPADDDPFVVPNIIAALASFQRALVSGDSPYDRWVAGDEAALSPAATRGMELFFSERTECYHCHSGLTFTTAFRSADTVFGSGLEFENTGLYNVGGTGAYPEDNTGLFEFTEDPRDMGRFRVPTLRNIALTAPYMHDGSVETLEAVIEHYAAGGRTIPDGPHAGVGASNPYKNSLVRELTLSDAERADLVEFMRSLTDRTFVTDERFADPFE